MNATPKTSNLTGPSVLALLALLLGMAMGTSLGTSVTGSEWRKDAVKQGKAEYITTPGGTPLWRWKP